MVAQENAPLTAFGDCGGLPQDVGDRIAVLLGDGHVHPRHQREVKSHVALVAVAEIGARVLRPLVRLGQQHPAVVMLVQIGADRLEDRVGLRQVLVVGAVAFHQIGDRVKPQTVHALVQPEMHDLQNAGHHVGVVEVQVRLMVEEPVPVELAGHRIPGPVAVVSVVEDHPRLVHPFGRIVGPDVEIALGTALGGPARALEPRMLVGGVVDDQFGNDLQAAAVRFLDEGFEIRHRPVGRIDLLEIGDVVAVVAQRRRIERKDPDRRCAQFLHMVEPAHQSGEIADAVAVGVHERLDVQLIDDRVAVPVRHLGHGGIGDHVLVDDIHNAPPGGCSFQIA